MFFYTQHTHGDETDARALVSALLSYLSCTRHSGFSTVLQNVNPNLQFTFRGDGVGWTTWCIEDYYEGVVVLLVVQSVEQGYQPAKSIDQILGELPVLYRKYMECGNGNAELNRMAAIIRSSNCMPPRCGDILRLLSRHGRFRMQQTGGTVLIGVTYSRNEHILRIPSYIENCISAFVQWRHIPSCFCVFVL